MVEVDYKETEIDIRHQYHNKDRFISFPHKKTVHVIHSKGARYTQLFVRINAFILEPSKKHGNQYEHAT